MAGIGIAELTGSCEEALLPVSSTQMLYIIATTIFFFLAHQIVSPLPLHPLPLLGPETMHVDLLDAYVSSR